MYLWVYICKYIYVCMYIVCKYLKIRRRSSKYVVHC